MNRIITIISTLVLSLSASAQNVTDCFKTSPSEIFNAVDSVNKIKLCDLNSKASTIFGDTITVNHVNDKFMSFTYTNTEVRIRLIDDMIVVSESYGSDVKSSEIRFFDKQWTLLSSWIYGIKHSKMMPSDDIIMHAVIEKPDTMSTADYEQIKLYLDPMYVEARLSETDDAVTLNVSAPLLSEEENTKLKTVIKQKTFKWTNGKFK